MIVHLRHFTRPRNIRLIREQGFALVPVVSAITFLLQGILHAKESVARDWSKRRSKSMSVTWPAVADWQRLHHAYQPPGPHQRLRQEPAFP
jgi:hypothetical protein